MEKTKSLNRYGISRIFQITGFLIGIGFILFLSAGRIYWVEGWVYLGLYLGSVLMMASWSLRNDPDLVNERGRMAENVKSWDKIIVSLNTLIMLVLLVIAGLDARFRWTTVDLGWEILGAGGFILSMLITFWAMTTNHYLAAFVRIQDDRAHQVVRTGPYRYVRHPMYMGSIFLSLGTPLLLGSLWALIPGILSIILVIVRTKLEDKTLQAELPGYSDYAQQVRYRLLPGIW